MNPSPYDLLLAVLNSGRDIMTAAAEIAALDAELGAHIETALAPLKEKYKGQISFLVDEAMNFDPFAQP